MHVVRIGIGENGPIHFTSLLVVHDVLDSLHTSRVINGASVLSVSYVAVGVEF